jgi:hypothetical protein
LEVRVLDIQPNIDYASKYIHEYGWDLIASNSSDEIYDQSDRFLEQSPKCIAALRTYSRDYANIPIDDLENEVSVHAFLSSGTGHHLNIKDYVEAYEKNLTYKEFRRLCYMRERKRFSDPKNTFYPKSLIKTDDQIEKMCEEDDLNFKRELDCVTNGVYVHTFVVKAKKQDQNKQKSTFGLPQLRNYLVNLITSFFALPIDFDDTPLTEPKTNLFGLEINLADVIESSRATFIKKKYSRVEI